MDKTNAIRIMSQPVLRRMLLLRDALSARHSSDHL